jgi:hypothetical protein
MKFDLRKFANGSENGLETRRIVCSEDYAGTKPVDSVMKKHFN